VIGFLRNVALTFVTACGALGNERMRHGCLPCPQGSLRADSDCLSCLLHRGSPFLVGRPSMGSEVLAACLAAVYRKSHPTDVARLTSMMPRKELQTNAGIRTNSTADAIQYGLAYARAVNASDLVARYGAIDLFNVSNGIPLRGPSDLCSKHSHFQVADALLAHSGHYPLRIVSPHALSPYAVGEVLDASESGDRNAFGWLRSLRGKTVLVVHPFVTSISRQLQTGAAAIWGPALGGRVMPDGIRWKLVRPPVNLGASAEHGSWRLALRDLIEMVDAAGEFDVALMACGGLGMLLGAHLRATDRSSIYVGGNLQIWFGIMGRRWAKDGVLTRIYRAANGSWVRPNATSGEVPLHARSVEGSAYW